MIQWRLVNNYAWILQRHPHVLHGCCRPEVWSLESSSSWAQWFSASSFQLPPLLISDFKITTRKRARLNEHRRQIALVSLRILGFQFHKHAAASPAPAGRQNRSTWMVSWRQRCSRGNQTSILPVTRKEAIIVSGLGHTEQKKLQGCGMKRSGVMSEPCEGHARVISWLGFNCRTWTWRSDGNSCNCHCHPAPLFSCCSAWGDAATLKAQVPLRSSQQTTPHTLTWCVCVCVEGKRWQ